MSKCPKCGYCKECGRSDFHPYPYPNYWWFPYWSVIPPNTTVQPPYTTPYTTWSDTTTTWSSGDYNI